MTKSQMADLMARMHEEEQATREDGQKEYAHDTSNALANFERIAASLNLTREQVLWVYLQKHLDGITAWINGHRSQREREALFPRSNASEWFDYRVYLNGPPRPLNCEIECLAPYAAETRFIMEYYRLTEGR